jgi:hypothetical protein
MRDAYGILATEEHSDFEAIERKVRDLREWCLAANMDGSCNIPTPML